MVYPTIKVTNGIFYSFQTEMFNIIKKTNELFYCERLTGTLAILKTSKITAN